MTDETPQPESEPSPASPAEAPTAETKAFTYDDAIAQEGARTGDEDDIAPAEAPTQAAPVAAPVAATAAPGAPVAAAPATSDRPAGIFVPKWVGLIAAAIVAALIFGGIGYAIGDSSDSGTTQNASNAFPNGNANGGQQLPGGGQFPGYNGQLPNGGQIPNGNGNGNSNGNGDGTTASNAGFL